MNTHSPLPDARDARRAANRASWARRMATPDGKARWKAYREQVKWTLVQHLGGQCQRCSWRPRSVLEAVGLDFHHRDPHTKSFTISKSYRRKLAALTAEVEKCDLLCATCHRIVEAKLVAAEEREYPNGRPGRPKLEEMAP